MSFLLVLKKGYQIRKMAQKNLVFSQENMCKIVQNKFKTQTVTILSTEINSPPKDIIAMMSKLHKVKIIVILNDCNQEINIITKTPANSLQTDIARKQGAFEKEIYMYEILSKEFQKVPGYNFEIIPECYLTIKNHFLALDDLGMIGYKNVSGTIMLDLKHLTIALTTIARFHVATIIFENYKRKEINAPYNLFEEYPEAFQEPLYRQDKNYFGYAWVQTSLKTLKDLYEFTDTVEAKDADLINAQLDNIALKIFEIMKPSPKFRNVLCHGDLWSPNILFSYENGEPINCKLIDFQRLRYNPPSHDVMNLIYSSTDFQFRQKHMQFLLDHYYQSLNSESKRHDINIDNEITSQEFQEMCKYVLPQVLFQSASFANIDLILLKPEILSNPETSKKFIFEDRREMVRKGYEKYENYRNHINEMLMELKNFLISNEM